MHLINYNEKNETNEESCENTEPLDETSYGCQEGKPKEIFWRLYENG